MKRLKNAHENDALAAALKAWKKHREFFIRTRSSLRRRGLMKYFDKIVIMLLKKETNNIKNAIKMAMTQKSK
jgi:predicted RNase H-like nuclease (RuvC/YqgF family)